MRVVVAAAIQRDDRLLVAQRAHPQALAGLWELPGGKVESGESEHEALSRECREELGVGLVIAERIGVDLPINAEWVLRAYVARITEGEPQPLEHLDLRWAAATELASLRWVPGNERLVPPLSALLS